MRLPVAEPARRRRRLFRRVPAQKHDVRHRPVGLVLQDRDSICCEFRAHEVHSASVVELGRMIKELRRLNKRVPQRVHGQSYPTT